ncbi:fumarylacetoacetate hydrolase family protein [Poriferisphaera sp. WC338]|uniref:fumarylacetoacetate hydrolase family protein n=1 Tax=Poriferisphaera sp. WC338 TaxID=3425129 RepID=UPI003D81C3BE
MKIVRFSDDDGNCHYGKYLDQESAEIFTAPAADADQGMLHQTADWVPTGQVARIKTLLAPLLPANIYCIGRNYAEHAKEGGAEIPTSPVVFMKPTSAVTDPGSPVVIPACSSEKGEVDYEAELAVVIGIQGKNISEAAALDHVLGYTIANDISARKWQKHSGGGQWIRGKSFDTFCPLGPILVTADEITDPQNLSISLTLNGNTMQEDTTANMMFSVAKLISFISQDTTLLPGTIILTGTPAGVGFARTPPVWLQPGDTVSATIENIGTLTNHVAAP